MRRKVYFTNSRGETILIDGHVKPLLLSRLEGTGGSPVEVQMQKAPYQDGETYIDSLLGPRYLSIEGLIWATKQGAVLDRRQRLARVFNPSLGLGTFRLELGHTAYEIDAAVDSPVAFPDRTSKPIQSFAVSLVCPDPAWREPTDETWTLASFVGGFSFPFSFPLSFGTVGQELDIENKGDMESPVLIRMTGPLTNPVLENVTTGQRITITREIQGGETLEINTAFGQKSVTIVSASGSRSNGFHYVSPSSEFWGLIPGLNTVSYAATEESANSSVTLSFYHRYSGV